MFLKGNFLAWRGWGACRVISPNPTWSLPLPSPNPDASLPVTFVRRRSTPPKSGSAPERAWSPPVPSSLMAQEPFVSGASWDCALVSRYQRGRISAHHRSPQPARPGLEVSGKWGPLVPHQPAISVANSHHPIYRLAAAFAE